ncbi:FAD-dependent oxidoreductase [Kitasatospora sp. NPDC002543]
MISRRTLLRGGGGLALATAVIGAGSAAAPVWGAPATEWLRLRNRLQGSLVLPSDPGYDLAKQLQIASYDAVAPQGIVYCETPGDVRTAISFAQYNGLGLRTRSGGHNFSGWSTGDGLVVDTSRLNQAVATGGTVHIGPGAKSVDALSALAPYGKQVVAGTCATVCPGGFIPGGGIGYQSRKFGLGSDRVVAQTIVLADGRTVRATAGNEPDLFWALNGGGGGNFGVVVDFEVRPIDAPTQVYFSLTWDWSKAESLFAAWQDSLVDGPDSFGSAFILALPDAAPGNTPTVLLTGCYQGPKAELDAILDGFAGAVNAAPLTRVVAEGTYAQAQMEVYHCGELTQDQCHRVGQTPGATLPRTAYEQEAYRFVAERQGAAGITDLVQAFDADRRAGQRRFLHCMGLGGQVSRVGRTDTAYVNRDALYVLGYVAELDKPNDQDGPAAAAWVDAGATVLDRIASGAYVNFPSTRLENWREAYYAENYPRLVDVKRRYDRDNFFRHPRSIGA